MRYAVSGDYETLTQRSLSPDLPSGRMASKPRPGQDTANPVGEVCRWSGLDRSHLHCCQPARL